MKIEASSIEEFFANCDQREADMRKLDSLVQEATGLEPVLFSGMGTIKVLGYRLLDYKPKSAPKSAPPSKWPLIAIAPQKNYLALYVCAIKDGKYLTEIYDKKLGKVNCGKSCIRFKNFEALDLPNITKLLKDATKLEKPFSF
jgi:hypothetical protein